MKCFALLQTSLSAQQPSPSASSRAAETVTGHPKVQSKVFFVRPSGNTYTIQTKNNETAKFPGKTDDVTFERLTVAVQRKLQQFLAGKSVLPIGFQFSPKGPNGSQVSISVELVE